MATRIHSPLNTCLTRYQTSLILSQRMCSRQCAAANERSCLQTRLTPSKPRERTPRKESIPLLSNLTSHSSFTINTERPKKKFARRFHNSLHTHLKTSKHTNTTSRPTKSVNAYSAPKPNSPYPSLPAGSLFWENILKPEEERALLELSG